MGIVETQVRKGIEPKSEVSIVFTGPFQNDEMRVVVSTMAETLSGDLFRTLRQDLGGTYGVTVEPNFKKLPTGEFRVTINFSCDPARTEGLVKAAFQLIEQFKAIGPAGGQVADARTALMQDFETNSQRNDYLVNRILFKYEYCPSGRLNDRDCAASWITTADTPHTTINKKRRIWLDSNQFTAKQ